MISPKTEWPQREKPVPASGLNFSEYFTESTLPNDDLTSFNNFIDAIPYPDLKEVQQRFKEVIKEAVKALVEVLLGHYEDLICGSQATWTLQWQQRQRPFRKHH